MISRIFVYVFGAIFIGPCFYADYRATRWEQFAPGKVRAVHIEKQKNTSTVNPDGEVVPAAPKKRGRPPKNHAKPDEAKDLDARPKAKAKAKDGPCPAKVREEEDGPGTQGSGRAVLAVPPADPGMVVASPEPPSGSSDNPHQKADHHTWPTRSTFAGRPRGADGSSGADLWDSRRSKYYTDVPNEFWKDGLERQYWKLCVDLDDPSKAVTAFMAIMSPPKQPPKAKATSAVIWLI